MKLIVETSEYFKSLSKTQDCLSESNEEDRLQSLFFNYQGHK